MAQGGPYVIRCGATGGYLANGGRVVFRKAGARGFSILERAQAAFRREQRSADPLIDEANSLEWEIIPSRDAQDLSI